MWCGVSVHPSKVLSCIIHVYLHPICSACVLKDLSTHHTYIHIYAHPAQVLLQGVCGRLCWQRWRDLPQTVQPEVVNPILIWPSQDDVSPSPHHSHQVWSKQIHRNMHLNTGIYIYICLSICWLSSICSVPLVFRTLERHVWMLGRSHSPSGLCTYIID